MIAPDEIIVDLFAGGGGASLGIWQALGRHPDVAVNHSPDAVAVHTRNHPGTHHYCESVWRVRPEDVCAGRAVGLLWASPDCRHFSRAAGGGLKSDKVRSLPGVVLTWAKRAQPRVIIVENVREMMGWGPLLDDGTPCPRRVGHSWNRWVGRLRGLGYRVQWRELCAADYGAPTIRTRLFVQARLDNEPIEWPAPTHSREPSIFAPLAWRPAAECIDWSIPCPSIFTRRRPLQDATLRRIAHGVRRHVLDAPNPFIVQAGMCAPSMTGFYGQDRGRPATEPLGAITAQGQHLGLVSASLAPITHQGSQRGSAITVPLPTITCANRGEQALITAFLAQHNLNAVGRSARDPMATIMTAGTQTQVVTAELSDADNERAERVSAFLIHYYSHGKQTQALSEPLGATTTRARFALVTVAGVPRPIVDIGMRMLTPAELAAAQGFPADYDLTDDGRLTKTRTIHLIGNSVCPPVAAAMVRAALGRRATVRAAA